MIRGLLLIVFLGLTAVSAQPKWPMISVNAQGEIVLQSLTRATSFRFNPVSALTGPTTGSASISTVPALTAGVSVFTVSAPSGYVTNHGLLLPTPAPGLSISLLQTDANFVTYLLYAKSGNFINADSTTVTMSVGTRVAQCVAATSTRWDCTANSASGSTVGTITGNPDLTLTGANVAVTATTTNALQLNTAGAGTAALYTVGGGNVYIGASTAGTTQTGTVTIKNTGTFSVDSAVTGVSITPTGNVQVTASGTNTLALSTAGAGSATLYAGGAGNVYVYTTSGGTVNIGSDAAPSVQSATVNVKATGLVAIATTGTAAGNKVTITGAKQTGTNGDSVLITGTEGVKIVSTGNGINLAATGGVILPALTGTPVFPTGIGADGAILCIATGSKIGYCIDAVCDLTNCTPF